jgi:hypothetical protein
MNTVLKLFPFRKKSNLLVEQLTLSILHPKQILDSVYYTEQFKLVPGTPNLNPARRSESRWSQLDGKRVDKSRN